MQNHCILISPDANATGEARAFLVISMTFATEILWSSKYVPIFCFQHRTEGCWVHESDIRWFNFSKILCSDNITYFPNFLVWNKARLSTFLFRCCLYSSGMVALSRQFPSTRCFCIFIADCSSVKLLETVINTSAGCLWLVLNFLSKVS